MKSEQQQQQQQQPPSEEERVVQVGPSPYWNVGAFFLYFVSAYVADQFLPDNAVLSNKYQTLVTPAPYAFAIWGIIFLSELVWVTLQASAKDRSTTASVGYNFILAYIAQSAWTFIFGSELMILSLVAMISILIPLTRIMDANTSSTSTSFWRRFPFDLHGGWIWAATLVNCNVILVQMETSALVQTYAAYTSLAVLVMVGFYYAYKKRVYVVPVVFAWASFAIHKELLNPRQSIVDKIDTETIQNIETTSFAVSILALLLATVIPLYRWLFSSSSSSPASNGYVAVSN